MKYRYKVKKSLNSGWNIIDMLEKNIWGSQLIIESNISIKKVAIEMCRLRNAGVLFGGPKLDKMKELTEQQIDDRIVVWDEAIDHLGGDVYDTVSEREQGKIVQDQLIKMRDLFCDRHPIPKNRS